MTAPKKSLTESEALGVSLDTAVVVYFRNPKGSVRLSTRVIANALFEYERSLSNIASPEFKRDFPREYRKTVIELGKVHNAQFALLGRIK